MCKNITIDFICEEYLKPNDCEFGSADEHGNCKHILGTMDGMFCMSKEGKNAVLRDELEQLGTY